jgi:hypothetical protein
MAFAVSGARFFFRIATKSIQVSAGTQGGALGAAVVL